MNSPKCVELIVDRPICPIHNRNSIYLELFLNVMIVFQPYHIYLKCISFVFNSLFGIMFVNLLSKRPLFAFALQVQSKSAITLHQSSSNALKLSPIYSKCVELIADRTFCCSYTYYYSIVTPLPQRHWIRLKFNSTCLRSPQIQSNVMKLIPIEYEMS